MTELELAIEAKLELCRRDFSEFYSFITGWSMPDHIKALSNRLQNMIPGDKLIVAMPPRTSKSTTISQLFPIWLMGNAQMLGVEEKIGNFTYGQKLSNNNSRQARSFLQSMYYGLVFPTARLLSENVEEWSLITEERRVSYLASSVGGAATGYGFTTLIIDDPVKDWEQARNRDLMDKIYDWYCSVASTRLEKDGKEIVLATRWSEFDLTGRLLDTGKFQYIEFPAISEENESIWPSQWPVSRYEEIKEQVGARVWECLYQQNPLPEEGKLIKKEYIHHGILPHTIKKRLIAWDTASTINDSSDHSVGIQIAQDEMNTIFIEDMIRVKLEFPELVKTIARWGTCENVYIEDAASGIQALQVLKRETCRKSFTGKKVKLSKEARLEAITPKFEGGKIIFAKDFPELEKELLQFPDGRHDDCVDALTLAVSCCTNTDIKAIGSRDEVLTSSSYSGLF